MVGNDQQAFLGLAPHMNGKDQDDDLDPEKEEALFTIDKVKQAREKFEREVAAHVVTRPELTFKEIGKLFGIPSESVKYIVVKLKVPRRKPGRKPRKETTF
jgi:hypothetical protein